MNNSKVPQHDISTYANNKKAIYATDESGAYTIVPSSGWKVEEEATKQALDELQRLADRAYERVSAGEVSPLYFHMYDRRMELQTLAQATGLFKWRIKRHFRPPVFHRLSSKMLERYSDTLGVSVEILCTLPARGENDG